MSDHPCPKCGHCPTCGRSNQTYPFQVYPQSGYPYPFGRYPYTSPYGGTALPKITYWNNNAATNNYSGKYALTAGAAA